MSRAIIPESITVYMVKLSNCLPVGHSVCFNSVIMFLIVSISLCRPTPTRTENYGFGDHCFNQLKLWALVFKTAKLFNLSLLMCCMVLTYRTVFVLFYFLFNIFCFVSGVVFTFTYSTFQSDYVSFNFCHTSACQN